MAKTASVAGSVNGLRAQISTFAVLDLETTNLPAFSNNRVGITELCIYAFDPACLKDYAPKEPEPLDELEPPSPNILPLPPRVLHKINLLFQPTMVVNPTTENITGLSNYLLERESKLNENAAQMIISFLEHLPAPVCLIAHNGWYFDFPIVRQAFDKLNLKLPGSILCVDSLRAFMEIDEKRTLEICANNVEPELQLELNLQSEPKPKHPIINKTIDWQLFNETTPNRPILPRTEAARKRKRLADGSDDEDNDCIAVCSAVKRMPRELGARRHLFAGLNCAQTKRFPPRGLYKLEHLFERTFRQPAIYAHQAEADVIMLMKLIQYYGVDFLAFAEEQAIPFAEVVPLGGKIPANIK